MKSDVTVSLTVQSEQEKAVKRSSDGQIKCTCKSAAACKSKLCGCKKVGSHCSKDCKCDPNTCKNRDASRTLFGNSSSEISSDENRSSEASFKKPRATVEVDS
ncbi:hypothetical protein L9F63_014735 [Diploptera punctata]|nr:hypothetical protein L9F63_014735 [Diploptera punctata]